MKNIILFCLIVSAFAVMSNALAAATVITNLRCEYLENPLGMDAARPRLSWIIESDQRAQKQTAYQVLVAGAEDKLRANEGDLWDSGKVASDETAQIYYNGKPLASRQQCFWKVRVWDQDGNMSESNIARWEMGLLKNDDWKAKWIARTTDVAAKPAPLLRREFKLDGRVKQARAYITGLGYYELYLNGKRVGDHILDPGYTRYDRRVLYVSYDVTDMLNSGPNAIGVILGNGWYNVQNKAAWNFDQAPWRAAPKLLCQIEAELDNGERIIIAGDESWKSADGPIVYNTIYSGEIYDARLEQPGWDRPGFDDSQWSPALLVEPPKGILAAQMMPPIRADREIEPVKISEPRPGVYVFDFGQNMAGNARLRVSGPAGTKVSMKYSELLAPDGNVDQKNIAVHVLRFGADQIFQTDTYILKGEGVETWHSRFAYDGFRYVEATGFPGRPEKDALTAVFFHTDVPVAGVFECSNPMLNRIWSNARWSYLSNLEGIPTDCPHREKNGWTGDAHLAAEQAMFNYFPAAFYTKWINDLGDEQQPDGRLPGIVPSSGWGYAWGNGPAWDNALLLIPYYQYLYYGDTEILRVHYEGMKRYVDYLTGRAKDGIVNIGLNDWSPWKTKTEAGITDTAYYYVDARVVSLAAGLLHKNDDAQKYNDLAASIKKAFNAKFYQPETGIYDNGGQTALSCALCQGLVEPENKARVLANLIAAVEKQDWHIDTGILGAKYLLNTLLENGRADVAYRIVAQKTKPGWGYWIEQGATTLWEGWGGGGSQNHIMYGDVVAWFYKALAGINPDPAAPGFKHFIIKPNVVGDLTSARGEYNSIRGKIVSDWKVADGQFSLNLTIPANTTATVYLPIADAAQVREQDKPANNSPGITFLRTEDQRTVWTVGSGDYCFIGPLAK
ncbi:MAG: glycoside hydrolase family 78 protein [Thermoguttaceae bacterium]|jgi:alpha-L-rhamnosidase